MSSERPPSAEGESDAAIGFAHTVPDMDGPRLNRRVVQPMNVEGMSRSQSRSPLSRR